MSFQWRRFAFLLLAGAGAGLLWNTLSGRGFALNRSVLTQEGDRILPVAQAKALHDRSALFLDARPRDFWRMNRIPNALSLPEDDFDRALFVLRAEIRRANSVVVYCSGFGCEASHVVARKLRERGFDAAVLDEGLPAWEDAKLPIDREPKP